MNMPDDAVVIDVAVPSATPAEDKDRVLHVLCA